MADARLDIADWDAQEGGQPQAGEELIVDIDGFEGPLDLLLYLARRQKVDLSRISILALAKQYLEFIEHSRVLRLEVAADYLVTAAWLAFLKTKLLLPRQKADTGEEELSAEALRFRLRRLEAMRRAGARLMEGKLLGRDVFPRGAAEKAPAGRRPALQATLHDLLSAFAEQRRRQSVKPVEIAPREVWDLPEAREFLQRAVAREGGWLDIRQVLRTSAAARRDRVGATASIFAASLELAREGAIEIAQTKAFAPLLIRRPPAASEPA